LEIVAAVAIGLNPFVGTFVLAVLAAFTDHVPQSDLLAALPGIVPAMLALAFGILAPFDFVLGKFVRFAPALRRAAHFVAPASGALLAAAVARPEWPLVFVAAMGAVVSWLVATMVTSAAARASRSPAWVGLGHIPVLMACATGAACMIPLGLAKPGIGLSLAGVALLALGWSTVAAWRRDETASPALRRKVVSA
jgi:hypothetical protein